MTRWTLAVLVALASPIGSAAIAAPAASDFSASDWAASDWAASDRAADPKAPPPVFTQKSYADARALAKKDAKWLIVKATAEWCGPCKMMDKTTWVDPKIVAWVEKNAIAIQLDVDDEPKIAKDLDIDAMPTMVAFNKEGAEFDRIVGYRSAEDLLIWLDGVVAGKKSIEAVKDRARNDKGGDGLQARYQLTKKLVDDKKYDEALAGFVALWDDMRGTSMIGVRGSFMAGDMAKLAKRHKPAAERFAAMRDKLAEALKAPKIDRDELDDWIVLNEILGEQDATLAWYDRIKGDDAWKPIVSNVGFRLQRLLEERGRWSDLGMMFSDPVAALRRDIEMFDVANLPDMPEAQRKMMAETHARMLRDKASLLYAASLAARREKYASAVAEIAIKADDSSAMRIALVARALKAKQARAEQLRWLDAAKADPAAAPMREDVENALKNVN